MTHHPTRLKHLSYIYKDFLNSAKPLASANKHDSPAKSSNHHGSAPRNITVVPKTHSLLTSRSQPYQRQHSITHHPTRSTHLSYIYKQFLNSAKPPANANERHIPAKSATHHGRAPRNVPVVPKTHSQIPHSHLTSRHF